MKKTLTFAEAYELGRQHELMAREFIPTAEELEKVAAEAVEEARWLWTYCTPLKDEIDEKITACNHGEIEASELDEELAAAGFEAICAGLAKVLLARQGYICDLYQDAICTRTGERPIRVKR